MKHLQFATWTQDEQWQLATWTQEEHRQFEGWAQEEHGHPLECEVWKWHNCNKEKMMGNIIFEERWYVKNQVKRYNKIHTDLLMEIVDLLAKELATPREKAVENAELFRFVTKGLSKYWYRREDTVRMKYVPTSRTILGSGSKQTPPNPALNYYFITTNCAWFNR